MERTGNILVIDDDPDTGRMIKGMLEFKGYAVTLIESGDQVHQSILKNNIDLVIMDMLLSGTNGIDICTRIKKDTATSYIPLIMMSAHPDAKKKSLRAGADDFLSKPFEIRDIFTKIDFLLSRNKKMV